MRPQNLPALKLGQTVKVNEFFTLTNLKNLPQQNCGKEVGVFSVNGLFGTENQESTSRVTLTTNKVATKNLCEKIIKAKSGGSFKVNKANFIALNNLLWQGVVSLQ